MRPDIFAAAARNDKNEIDAILAANPDQLNARYPRSLFLKAASLPFLFAEKAVYATAFLAAIIVPAPVFANDAKAALEQREMDLTREGGTPLHFAAKAHALTVVVHLLKLGANPTIRTHDGKTFLDLAPNDTYFKECCQLAASLYVLTRVTLMTEAIHAAHLRAAEAANIPRDFRGEAETNEKLWEKLERCAEAYSLRPLRK